MDAKAKYIPCQRNPLSSIDPMQRGVIDKPPIPQLQGMRRRTFVYLAFVLLVETVEQSKMKGWSFLCFINHFLLFHFLKGANISFVGI